MEKALEAGTGGHIDSLDEEPVVSKTRIVQNIIHNCGEVGVTAADIKRVLEKRGHSLARNVVYSTLARVREEAAVTKKGDRCFWKKAYQKATRQLWRLVVHRGGLTWRRSADLDRTLGEELL